MIATLIILLVLAAFFFITGTFLLAGRGAFLIAGYNTMPRKDKERYDEKKLCRFMGKVFMVLGVAMLIWTAGEIYPGYYLWAAAQGLLFATLVFTLIYANTNDRFLKKRDKNKPPTDL